MLDTQKYQLTLRGPEEKDKISETDGRIADSVFQTTSLNQLTIDNVGLVELPQLQLIKLSCLHSLQIVNNSTFKEFPVDLTSVPNLKFIDLSNNQLFSIPLALPESLETLKVSNNVLNKLDISSLSLPRLTSLDASYNSLKTLELPHLPLLRNLLVSNNELTGLPTLNDKLPVLKKIDLLFFFSEHKIRALKELVAHSNPLKDKRLKKIVDDQRPSSTKSAISFLKSSVPKEKNDLKIHISDQQQQQPCLVQVLKTKQPPSIHFTKQSVRIRGFCVACVIRQLDFQIRGRLKALLKAHSNLHDGKLCEKRSTVFIGLHDWSILKLPLQYKLSPIDSVTLTPFGEKCEMTTLDCLREAKKSAEANRKSLRRANFSTQYKYMNSINKNNCGIVFLVDANNLVISVPPLSTCEQTKIKESTTDILIEVTSALSEDVCLRVMDEMLKHIVRICGNICVQQVIVYNGENSEICYPDPERTINGLDVEYCSK
ncbi:hypothetical protein ACOME3_008555 [Neoechinorhynchus agilis]